MIADDLESFQRTVTRALLALAAVHVPIVALIAGLRGQNVLLIALIAAAFAAVPALMYRANRPIETVGAMLGVALVAQTSLAVYVMRGHAWQVETHFYYFAVLALLLGFCSWRILVFSAGLIAVHHLTLDTFLPAAIYPGGTDIARALVHGGVVVVETAMLVVIGTALREAFTRTEAALRRAEEAGDDRYDYVFVDCPPSLGLLTLNALVAGEEMLIPIQAEYYALEGLGQLLETVEMVKAHLNPRLVVSTIVVTMYDARTRLASGVAEEVRAHFADQVLNTTIPRSVRVSEAPSYGQSVMTYDPGSPGALSYLEAAREMATRGSTGE